MISQKQIEEIYAVQSQFRKLIILNPSTRSDSFTNNEFMDIIINGINKLLEYIAIIIAFGKYIENNKVISEEIDNIIKALNELYYNYQREDKSNLFDINQFVRNNVSNIIHLADKIEKIYKDILKKATDKENLINEL